MHGIANLVTQMCAHTRTHRHTYTHTHTLSHTYTRMYIHVFYCHTSYIYSNVQYVAMYIEISQYTQYCICEVIIILLLAVIDDYYVLSTDITVTFEKKMDMYCVTKDNKTVQPALNLSSPSFINISVEVFMIITSIGKEVY